MIINFITKYGDRFIESNSRSRIFSLVLRERIEDGWYESPAEVERARCHLMADKAEAFLHSRRHHEYEAYEQITMEHV